MKSQETSRLLERFFYENVQRRLRLFQDNGWSVSGTIDDTLKLERSSEDSRLNAVIGALNLGNGSHMVTGRLDAPDTKGIKEIDYLTTTGELLLGLGRRIVGFEIYFNGLTNFPEVLKVYRKYRIPK